MATKTLGLQPKEIDDRIICGWDNSSGLFASIPISLKDANSDVNFNKIIKCFKGSLENSDLPEEKRSMVYVDIHWNNFRFHIRIGTYSPHETKDDVQLREFINSTASCFIKIIDTKREIPIRKDQNILQASK